METTSEHEYKKEQLLKSYWDIASANLEKFGDFPFIVTKHGSLSYRRLKSRSNAIARAIQNANAQPQLGVCILIDNPLDVVPALVGVVKAKDYFAVMDASFPGTTLKDMLQDAKMQIILTVSKYLKKARSLSGETVQVINIDEIEQDPDAADLIPQFKSSDWVQILFTSGSTGTPKGAIEDYQYLMRAVTTKLKKGDIQANDRILCLSRFTFSAPHFYVFVGLLRRMTVAFYNLKEDGLGDLPAWLEDTGVTNYHTNVTNFRNLVRILKPGQLFPRINLLQLTGEKASPSDVQSIKAHFPSIHEIHWGYAATETQSITHLVTPLDFDFEKQIMTVGKPHDDIKVFIWDEENKELPPGKEGEIVVYGDSHVEGYINDKELSARKFLTDPKGSRFRYYKTGDLGKFLPNGELVHLGRIDNMVKIRGIRIELESIENRLMLYPGILQVASKAIEDAKGNKRLATYFVVENNLQIPISDLRKFLSEKLPAQYLPHYLISLDAMPVTENGKIAFSKLPMPALVRPHLSNDYVPAQTEVEKKLLEIWEDLLGIKGIGVTDDFFDVGGDSLLGVVLFVSIEKAFQRVLPVSTLLTAPTIRDQAKIIMSTDQTRDFVPVIPIRPQGDQVPLIFIPGKGGYPTRVRHIAKILDPRTPIYAVQDLLKRGDWGFQNTIESAASFYLAEIRKLYPSGPYILMGESLGGKIAFQMAQQLMKAGEKPPLLILLDTYNLDEVQAISRLSGPEKTRIYQMLVQKHLSILREADWQGKMEYFRFYRETLFTKIRTFLSPRLKRKKGRSVLPEDLQRMEKEKQSARKAYEVKSYPGQVILVRATRGLNTSNPTNGWDRVELGELIIHTLDCYHGSILFEPAVSQLAKIVNPYIEKINHSVKVS